MKRLLLVTTVFLLVAALPVSAKTPSFEMTVEPRGDTIDVEVTIGNEDPLFLESFDSPDLNGLIAVFPADKVDEEGRPLSVIDEGTEVPLRRVQAGTYQGSIALEPGHWAVVPFPSVTGAIRGTAEGWYPHRSSSNYQRNETPSGHWRRSAQQSPSSQGSELPPACEPDKVSFLYFEAAKHEPATRTSPAKDRRGASKPPPTRGMTATCH